MILSSCAVLWISVLSVILASAGTVFTNSLSSVFYKLKKFNFKGAFNEGLFIPLSVPSVVVLCAMISFVAVKEVRINKATIITYKECKSKPIETKVAQIKVPGCLLASR